MPQAGCTESTDMSKKVMARLRELAPATRGCQDARSRDLVFIFGLNTVQGWPKEWSWVARISMIFA